MKTKELSWKRARVRREDDGTIRKTWETRCQRHQIEVFESVGGVQVVPRGTRLSGDLHHYHYQVFYLLEQQATPDKNLVHWRIVSRHRTKVAAEKACQKHARGK